MFKCKSCIEKEKRVVELKEQVVFLRSLVFPAPSPSANYTDPYSDDMKPLPAPQVIDEQLEEIRKQQEAEQLEIDSEASRLTTGNY